MKITTPPEIPGYCTGPLEVAIPEATEETMATNRSWKEEDSWWRNNFSSRPYATGRDYEEFRPAYQYGYESGLHHMGREWNDVEPDLRTGWEKFEGRRGAGSTWDSVKHAIRDAWHRVTGKHDLDPDRMSEAEYDRVSQGDRTR
jgi:hypothetical protein